MKLFEIQNLSFQLEQEIINFNNSLPNGYFITTETDGSLLITRELDNVQTPIGNKYLKKEYLSEEDIEIMFKKCHF